MKLKHLFIVSFLLASLSASSQIIIYPNSGVYGVGYNRIVPLTTLWLPTGCGVPSGKASLQAPGTNPRQSAIFCDTCGHHIYWYHPNDSAWSRIDTGGGGGGSGTVTAVLVSNDSLYYTTSSGNTFVSLLIIQADSTLKYVTPTQLAAGLAPKLSAVSTTNSVTGAGTSGSPLQLVGDAPSPGNSYYYGTNGSGAKGYNALPSGVAGANPSQTISGSVVNGSASTFMRSDAAPAIGTNAVTNTLLAQMAANTIKGNNTGSTANAADLNVSQIFTLLGLGTAATHNVPASGNASSTQVVLGNDTRLGGGGGGIDSTTLADTAGAIRLSIFRVWTPQMTNPKAGDGARKYTGSMTSGSNVFTDGAHGQFGPADVGKLLILKGAGTGGKSLFTSVVSVTNSTTMVLADNAVNTVINRMYTYGTESVPAIQAAIDSCKAHKGSRVQMPNGVYLTRAPLQDTTGANAQIVIPGSPYQFDFARSVIDIEGDGNQLYATNYFSGTISAPLTGTVVLSMLDKGNTQLTPAVWGMQLIVSNFNADELQLHNITTLVYTDSGAVAPVLSCYDFRPLEFGGVYHCIAGTDVDVQSTTDPTGSHTAGFMLSHTSNGGPIFDDASTAYGLEYGHIVAEHSHLIMPQAFGCTNAYTFPVMAYPAHGTIAFEACKHGIVSPSSDFMGYAHGGGFLDLTIESEIDPNAGPIGPFWYNTVDQVTDTNCQLQGRTFWNNNLYNNTDYSNGVTSVGGCMLSINSAVQKTETQAFDSTQVFMLQGTRFNTQTGAWYQENNVASGLMGLFSGGFGFASFPASGRGSAPAYTWHMNVTPDGRVGIGGGPNPGAWFQFHAGDATYPQANLPESDLTSLHNSGDYGWDGAHLYFHTRTGLVNLLNAAGTVGGDGAIQYDSAGNQSGNAPLFQWSRSRQELLITGHLSVSDTSIFGARASYAGDYGSSFTPYSFVDKEYTDSSIAANAGLSNPMTALGAIIYGGISGTPTQLAGNTTAARKFYISQGTGSAAQAPFQGALISTDMPNYGVQSSSDAAAQTTAQTSLCTWAVPAGSNVSVMISGYINITAVATDVIQMNVAWTDENSNSKTASFFNMGATSATIGAIGDSNFPPMAEIKVKAGTTITVSTAITGAGTITYDCGATITKIR